MKKIFIILSILLLTSCGKNTVTKDEFKINLEKVINSKYNTVGYKGEYKNNKMIMSLNDKEYEMDVEFKEKFTITYNLEIGKGIEYEEYNKLIETLSLPMFGYVAYLSDYGISMGDASSYFGDTYLNGMLDNYHESKYMVIYNNKEKDMFKKDYEYILVKDFGDSVIDFVNDNYAKKIDFSDELNTYNFEVYSKCESDKCIITSKLIVNSESEFEDIKDYLKKQL